MGPTAVIPSMNLAFQVYLGPFHVYTVYAAELAGILLALLTAEDPISLNPRLLSARTTKPLFALLKILADS